MFAGLASPSHLIIVLVLILLLFGAKRIPELAKGLGTGIKELREGISPEPARRRHRRREALVAECGSWTKRSHAAGQRGL